jgi:chromosome segregation ATPase
MTSVSPALMVVFVMLSVANAQDRPTLDEYKQGKADDKAKVDATAAKQSKMSAVDKVVTMLEDLQAQTISEGEKEAASYNKFSCFCKDTTSEKTAAIKKGEDQKEELTADITSYAAKRDELDETIATLVDDIAKLDKEMKEAEEERAATLKVYTANEADLSGALDALNGAINAVKQSKKPSLAQMQAVSKTVKTAVLLAEALGLGSPSSRRAAASFIQQPANDVPMEDYKFHSNSIIDTLEQLQKDFTNEKNDVDAAEVKSVKEFDMLML